MNAPIDEAGAVARRAIDSVECGTRNRDRDDSPFGTITVSNGFVAVMVRLFRVKICLGLLNLDVP